MAATRVWTSVVSCIILGIQVLVVKAVPGETETCVPSAKCVCYDHIGCFSTSPPFNNAIGSLPSSPSKVGVEAQLFTRKNRNVTYPVDFIDKTSLDGSNFDPALESTKFVIHGFANTIKTEWLYQMKDELLKKGDFNVFIISWGPGAAAPNYFQAVANTRVVSRMVRLLIKSLVEKGLEADKIHIIAHSLGAQLSGVVGSMLKAENLTIGRISGMDPAEPNFLNYKDSIRLSKDDAKFVDVIHTDGQKFNLFSGYGIFIPCGHVDFYINGGLKQPDCKTPSIGGMFSGGGGLDEVTTAFSCSHSRSHEVYLESINSDCPFTAYPCDSYQKFQRGECLACGPEGCTRMGYPANRYYATGTFYLNTRGAEPFCGHHYSVTVQLGGTLDTKGKLMVQLNGLWGVSEWLDVTQSSSDRLIAGANITRVVVVEETVGYIQTMKVKFIASSGSRGSVFVADVEIEAGENGFEYLFCIKSTLTNSTELEKSAMSAGGTCS